MKNLAKRVAAVFNKPRVLHYVDIFLAGAGTALYFNRDDLLGAHGLNVVGSLMFGACVAGGKAVFEAFRNDFSLPPAAAAEPDASKSAAK